MILTLAQSAAENAQQQIDMTVDTATPATLGFSVAIGLLLWFMGKKLSKPSTTLCGVLLGAAGTFVATQHLVQSGEQVKDGALLLWLAGGAIAGGLLAAMLYRIWMAASTAILAALIVAAASIVWVGGSVSSNANADPKKAGSTSVADNAEAKISRLGTDGTENTNKDGEGDKPEADKAEANTDSTTKPNSLTDDLPVNSLTTDDIEQVIQSEAVQEIKRQFLDLLRDAYANQAAHVQSWWQQAEASGQRNTYISMIIGALVGMLLGFVLPNLSASIQTAMVGGFLIICSSRGLAAVYAPDFTSWLPDTPPKMLMALGLITVIGVGVQWMIFPDKADK